MVVLALAVRVKECLLCTVVHLNAIAEVLLLRAYYRNKCVYIIVSHNLQSCILNTTYLKQQCRFLGGREAHM